MNSPLSGLKFKEINQTQYPMIMAWERIDYSKVYWIANGSDKIYDWAPDVIYKNVPSLMKGDDIKESLDKVLYVSDDILFGYNENLKRLELDCDKNHDNKICYAGYLRGTVAEKRPKILSKIFKENKFTIPTRIFGPGSIDIEVLQNKPNIEIIEDSFQGDEYYKFLNKQLAMIHFGKGKPNYSYISKSIYDCAVSGVPSLIYLPCDTKRLIFDNDLFYFSTEKELKQLYKKLQNNETREDYLRIQREWIDNTLSNKMYPNFKFADQCKEEIYNISTKLF